MTPELTCGLSIAGVAQLTGAQLHRLNLDDVAVSGDQMAVAVADVPGHATALIRVQLIDRRHMVSAYLTVAIPYVNAVPHLGYAYELVLADIAARARRIDRTATCGFWAAPTTTR